MLFFLLIEKILEEAEMAILTEALKDKKIAEARKKWEPFYNWMRDENMNELKVWEIKYKI